MARDILILTHVLALVIYIVPLGLSSSYIEIYFTLPVHIYQVIFITIA